MIKLAIVTTVPMTIQAFWNGQLDYLQANGFDVTVITSGKGHFQQPSFQASWPEGIKYKCIEMSRQIEPLQDLAALCKLILFLRKEKFDIVQYATPKASLLSAIAAWTNRVPVRLYLMWGLYYTTQTGVKRTIFKCFEHLICLLSTSIAPDSYGNCRFAVKEGLCTAGKISVVHNGSANGVDTERFHPQRLRREGERIRAALQIPKTARLFGTIAPLVGDKGINELISAFEKLARAHSDVYLLIIGASAEKDPLHSDTLEKIEQHPRILNIGWQTNPELFLAAMNIFVLPTYREGFGMTNIEAGAMELPVISTKVPGPQESIIDGKTGLLVPARTVTPLVKAMKQLLDEPEFAKQLGIAGRQRVLQYYEQKELWQAIAGHRRKLFTDAVKSFEERKKQRGKRAFDLLLSLLLLPAAVPLMLVLAGAIRVIMGKPVLFRQKRPGLKGAPFYLYKFRTMLDRRDAQGELLPDAERLTAFGKFLRSTSLDELPELFHVLKGEMSLVGPRPLLMQYLDHYTPEQMRRHEIKPGITGWAQINGRNGISWDEKFTLDRWYVDHQSLWLDLKILAITVWKMLTREGISQEGQATMGKFTGNLK